MEISITEEKRDGSMDDLKVQEQDLGGSKGSWIGAVQGQKILRKYEVEVTMKDGIGSVLVPEEITKDVPPLWDDFLIGKFLDVAPHIAKVHAIVSKIWNLNDKALKIEVYEVNSTMMKFRIPNQADRRRILRRGMWNLAGVPVVMTKWSPVIEKEKPPTQSIPMWVHVKHVPLSMFSWQGLSFLTSPIGVPSRLHPETAQCLNLEVAKIFVRVDLTKDLPKKMNFNIQGEDVMVEYAYPWLPTKCVKCDKWGHSVKACPKEKEMQREEKKELEEGEISGAREGGKGEENVVMEKTQEENNTAKKRSKLPGTKIKEGEGCVSEAVIAQVSEKDKEWLEVSPGKSSRSSTPTQELKFGQVSILTKSRFDVLSPLEENEILENEFVKLREEEVQKEDQEENEVEEKLEEEVQEVIQEDDTITRKMLPRESKVNHRYLRDKAGQKTQDVDPSYLKKKKPRRQ